MDNLNLFRDEDVKLTELEKFQNNVSDLKDQIRSNQTTFFRRIPGFRNSKEYRDARDAFNSFNERWRDMSLSKITEARKMSYWDLASWNHAAENTRDMIERYLKAKDEECGGNLNRLPYRTRQRYYTMVSAKEELDAQIAEIEKREEELNNEPVKSLKELLKEADTTNDEIIGNKNVHLGSSEYKDAENAYHKLFSLMNALDIKGEENLSLEDMEEARRLAIVSLGKIKNYMNKHVDEEQLDGKRLNRMSAMSDGLDNARRILYKFNDLLDKAMEKPSDKDLTAIGDSVQDAYNGIEHVNWDVKIGSSEFKTAKNAFQEFNNAFKLYLSGDEIKNLSAGQLSIIREKMEKAEKEVDVYLTKKAGEQKTSDAAARRIDAMKKAQSAILEAKHKINLLNKESKKAASEKTENEVRKDIRDSYAAVTKRNNQAFFGSSKYKNAREAYSRIYEDLTVSKRKNNPPTEKEMKEMLKKIEGAKKEISAYIVEKQKQIVKKGPLDEKGKRRLSSMKNAYDSLEILSHRINEKLKEVSPDYNKARTDVKEKAKALRESAKTKEGAGRYIEKYAAISLDFIGKMQENRDVLTKEGKRIGRVAVISVLINLQKEKSGEKKMEGAGSFKEYNDNLNALADSKRFKELLPDDKMNPEYLLKLMNSPEELEKLRKATATELRTCNPKAKTTEPALNKPKLQPKCSM